MRCKTLLALFVWCHCYQLVLNPLFQCLLAFGDLNQNNRLASFYVSGSPITAEANQVALMPGQELVLHCKVAGYAQMKFNWFRRRLYPIKDGRDPSSRAPEEAFKTSDDRFVVTDNDFIIKSPTYSDVGDYYCRVKDVSKEEGAEVDPEAMIPVRAKPYILDFDVASSTYRSAIVEEGKSLSIPCNVVDDYATKSEIKISWNMSKFDENNMDEVTNGEDGIRIESINETSSVLIIDKVKKDHRRYYKCHVTNGVTDNEKVILIRVKDKYTVIWPTVGIVCELVILIGVICVVESRKVEPDLDSTNQERKAIQM